MTMKKLSIAIDMGAKNNGVFIIKTENENILDKKASCIVIDGKTINFSKKSRRENRHKDRNYKRRKLAKRFLKEVVDFQDFDEKQTQSIMGLLNNRGYTFLSSSTEFEILEDESISFVELYLEELKEFKNKEDFEEFFTNEFEDEKDLTIFLENQIDTIYRYITDLENYANSKKILADLESLSDMTITKFKSFSYVKNILFKYDYHNLGKNEKEIVASLKKDDFDNSKIEFEKEFEYIKQLNFTKESINNKKIILANLKELKDFFIGIKKEIETGSKPRKKYIKEIQEEINNLDFIKDKQSFLNLVANISNLQLRVLRKFFNFNSQINGRYEMLKRYFKAHHYKKEIEKQTKKELFEHIDANDNLVDFLQNTPAHLTIPPYEDMNNRDTYKCNSMLIKPELITQQLKDVIDKILNNPNFSSLLISDEYGVFERKDEYRVKPESYDKYIKYDFTYSKYLQRIFDSTSDITTKYLNPREVFKHKAMFERGTVSAITMFKKEFSEEIYKALEPIAQRYYNEESKIINGIYEESTSLFVKCNTNTSYKNNVKHTLLKPIYSYKFTQDESDRFIELIESKRGLKTALEHIATEAKKYQNSFYSSILACYENQKCSGDKELVKIVKNLDSNIATIKEIFLELNIKNSYFNLIIKIDDKNITRVLNILKQTYEILFKELGGFSKTCKHCTRENSIRSDENLVIGKRLLSDVAKPIDGMLDMMLDRLAYEITQQIDSEEINGIEELEILLEQNKFEFEENLNTIKRASNTQIKKYKRENKDSLNVNICPYTAKVFDKGDYDHILPQSKGVYNSKANMIYCSTDGNKEKGAKLYKLENLHKAHLKAIFQKDDLVYIEEFITKHINTIDKENFSNFDNLKLTQQIALRYALFMPNSSDEFKQAFTLVKLDKIKTITNGTQKRLARKLYEKLVQKYPNEFVDIEVNSKTISSALVSSTRKLLSESQIQLQKQTIQDSHSHSIDAMVVFYLANSKVKRDKPLDYKYKFEDVYLDKNNVYEINCKTTQWHTAKNKKFKIASKRLFDEKDIGVGYLQIKEIVQIKEKGKSKYSYLKGIVKDDFIGCSLTKKNFDYFINKNILEVLNVKRDKNIEKLYQVNKNNLYNILFNNKEEVLNNISHYNKLTKELRYTYTKVDPFEVLNKFLEPKSTDDKKAVKKIIEKENVSLDDITYHNLMAWFSRSNKLDKNGAKLGYYNSWRIFTKILLNNKNKIFYHIKKENGDDYMVHINKEKGLDECKKTLFQQTHRKKRRVKKTYTLYSASKNDTQYIHRRKNDKGEFIYQTRIANGHNKLKGFKKAFSENNEYFFKDSKNIIPLTIDNYKKAFLKLV